MTAILLDVFCYAKPLSEIIVFLKSN